MNTIEPPQRFRTGLWGIPLTSALTMSLTLSLVWIFAHTKGYAPEFQTGLWLICLVSIGTAGGGAIGVRVARLSWRQSVMAALLAGIGIMLLSRFEFSPFYPAAWDATEMKFNVGVILIGSALLSAPVFFLPLFDPLVRRSMLALATERIVLVALCLTLALASLDFLSHASGLITLIFGVFLSGFLLAVGLLAALVDPKDARGPWIGGLGLLLAPLVLIAWPMLGYGWLP